MKALVIYISKEQEAEIDKMVRIKHACGAFLPVHDAVDRLAATVLCAIANGRREGSLKVVDGAATMPSGEEL